MFPTEGFTEIIDVVFVLSMISSIFSSSLLLSPPVCPSLLPPSEVLPSLLPVLLSEELSSSPSLGLSSGLTYSLVLPIIFFKSIIWSDIVNCSLAISNVKLEVIIVVPVNMLISS